MDSDHAAQPYRGWRPRSLRRAGHPTRLRHRSAVSGRRARLPDGWSTRYASTTTGSTCEAPSKVSTDRAHRFCSALSTETRARPNWWVSIQTVANRLGMNGEDAIELADECAREGLVMHDQSQHTERR